MKMLMLNDVQQVPLAERFLLYARANLDAAIRLTDALRLREDEQSFADGAVTLSLAFHSVELFLKGAILLAEPGVNFKSEGHNIAQLERRYRKLYPAKTFRFEMPFRSEVAEMVEPDPELQRQLAEQLKELEKKIPQDQFLRYPANNQGEGWETVEQMAMGYSASLFASTLNRLRNDFVRLTAIWISDSAVSGKAGTKSPSAPSDPTD
jgi:hypothetical protein